MSAPLVRCEWKHPYHGDVVETLCCKHEQEVLVALKTLGIGGGFRYARPVEGGCDRCSHQGKEFRTYLASLLGRLGLLA